MIVFPSYRSSLGKKEYISNLHDYRTYVLLTDSCQIVGRCLRKKRCLMCRLCSSVCLLHYLGLHSKITQVICTGD